MRLLRVIRSLHPSGGGPVEGLKQCSPYLKRLGIETTVATLDTPSSNWLLDLPFKTISLGPVLGGYGYRPGLIKSLSLLSARFDAVIVEGLWQYHSYASWRAFRISPKPYYVFVHGMLDPWFKHAYPLKHYKKSLYWSCFESKLLRDAAAVLFTTRAERDSARESFINYNAIEEVVGYGSSPPPLISGTDVEAFYSSFPGLRGKDIYLFLGRLHPKKGVDLLIQAFAELAHQDPNCHLVLAGPVQPSYHRYLSKIIRTVSIGSQVTWTGSLTGPMKWSAFATAQLFCLPSHQENFGVAVAESLSVGLPVCISGAVNISDLVARSGAGLVHSDTLEGTSDALRLWANMDQHARHQMSRSATTLFFSEFHWEQVSLRLASLLFKGHGSGNTFIVE